MQKIIRLEHVMIMLTKKGVKINVEDCEQEGVLSVSARGATETYVFDWVVSKPYREQSADTKDCVMYLI